ncbi:MAG: hypothetical protein LBG59_02515 [Candidatus Peribacteria bacterium]|nr:hypothetical protein [Candidatus Peribacteria bacterium]
MWESYRKNGGVINQFVLKNHYSKDSDLQLAIKSLQDVHIKVERLIDKGKEKE